MPLSYRNQSIDLRSKSMDWFLYDDGIRHERVNNTGTLSVLLNYKAMLIVSKDLPVQS